MKINEELKTISLTPRSILLILWPNYFRYSQSVLCNSVQIRMQSVYHHPWRNYTKSYEMKSVEITATSLSYIAYFNIEK